MRGLRTLGRIGAGGLAHNKNGILPEQDGSTGRRASSLLDVTYCCSSITNVQSQLAAVTYRK